MPSSCWCIPVVSCSDRSIIKGIRRDVNEVAKEHDGASRFCRCAVEVARDSEIDGTRAITVQIVEASAGILAYRSLFPFVYSSWLASMPSSCHPISRTTPDDGTVCFR
jgi:hypothetical protein